MYTEKEVNAFCEKHDEYRDIYDFIDDLESSTDLLVTRGVEYDHGKIVIGDVIERRGYYTRDRDPNVDLIEKNLSEDLTEKKSEAKKTLEQFDIYDGRPIVLTVNYSFG